MIYFQDKLELKEKLLYFINNHLKFIVLCSLFDKHISNNIKKGFIMKFYNTNDVFLKN